MQIATYKSLCSVVSFLLLIANSPSEQQEECTKPIVTPNGVVNGSTAGNNIQLKCTQSESTSFKWFLNGELVPIINFLWVLIQPYPGGVIQCAENDCNILSDPVTIITHPEISSISSNVTANTGGNFSLQCNATGYPVPTITWYHKDAVVSNNAELVITSVTLNHQGLYTCLANNEAGYTTSVVWVVVLAPMESASSVEATDASMISSELITNTRSATSMPPTMTPTTTNNEGTPIDLIIAMAIIVLICTLIILILIAICYCSQKYCSKKLGKNQNKKNQLLDDIDERSTIKTSTSHVNASFKGEDDDESMKVELFVSDGKNGEEVLSAHAYKLQNANLYGSHNVTKSVSKEKMSKIQEKEPISLDSHEETISNGHSIEEDITVDNRSEEQSADTRVPDPKWLSKMKNQNRSHTLNAFEIVNIISKLDLMSVKKMKIHPLRKEFESIPFKLSSSKAWPRETMSKNRYADVFPSLKSAVTLSNTGEPASTYVNANYIRGYNGYKNTYISAQAPIYDTVPDFWRMVWESHIDTIVMLTGIFEGGKNKCAKYWPSSQDGDLQTYGKYMVQNVHEESYENYKITFLSVCSVDNPNEERDIYHFCFLGWPDFGVPNNGYGMMQLRGAVESIRNPQLPLLVHCSAGLGRSGTYIGIDIGIHQYDEEGVTDPLLILDLMRSYRGGMIQTLDQYEFFHRVLSNYVVQNPK